MREAEHLRAVLHAGSVPLMTTGATSINLSDLVSRGRRRRPARPAAARPWPIVRLSRLSRRGLSDGRPHYGRSKNGHVSLRPGGGAAGVSSVITLTDIQHRE